MEETTTTGYRGKRFEIPKLSKEGVQFDGHAGTYPKVSMAEAPVLQDLNTIWDLSKFMTPRLPITVSVLNETERVLLGSAPLARVLDMPIKFPGSNYRLPKELAPLQPIVQKIADYEATINDSCLDEYYCYLTLDRGEVKQGQTLREAPCHVDGFQGNRWNPKVRLNHTYSVSDLLSTSYYIQPFDFSRLDDSKHDFFWEMNRQVAATNSAYAWRPAVGAISLMDAYTVHRGTESETACQRTFLRLSYEVRIFDRLGNAHNPMFRYDWPMVKRDIEMLHLVPFDPSSDPSLRVFPHQKLDGTPHEERGVKTKPSLRPFEQTEPKSLTWVPGKSFLESPHWVYPQEIATECR